jgi:sec-independent protein translocase protein TatC
MAAHRPQPVIEHLYELRRRIGWSVLALMAGAVAGYLVRGRIIDLVANPLKLPLYYTSPAGGLDFVMRISFMTGAVLALPVLVYNLIRFIEPALGSRRLTRSAIISLILASYALAIGGIVFAYVAILPVSFHFFSEFNIGAIKPLISTSEYFSFISAALLTFAILFQLPLVLLFINNIRRFPPGTLRRYRKHVFIGSFVIALILPFTYDPLTQFVMAIPIVLLYEVSLLFIWLTNRRHWRANPRPVAVPAEEAPEAKLRPATMAILDLRPQSNRDYQEQLPAPIMPRLVDGTRPVQLG